MQKKLVRSIQGKNELKKSISFHKSRLHLIVLGTCDNNVDIIIIRSRDHFMNVLIWIPMWLFNQLVSFFWSEFFVFVLATCFDAKEFDESILIKKKSYARVVKRYEMQTSLQ